MDYQLTLATDIALSPADFVAVWNITTECRTIAEAHLSSHNLVVLKRREDLGTTTLRTIEKLVKEVLRREGISGVTITSQNRQDGTPLLVVHTKDQ